MNMNALGLSIWARYGGGTPPPPGDPFTADTTLYTADSDLFTADPTVF